MGASNAWAETETTTLLNIDYSTVTTPAWTVVGGSGTTTDGAWTHTHDGGNGARSAYLDFGLNSSIDDNWTASFDVTTTTGSTWTQASDFQIAITKNGATYSNNVVIGSVSDILFGARIATTKSNMGTSLACTITLNGVDIAGTTTLNHGTKYTFNVSVNGTALTASIMNGETEVYTGNATLDAFVKPRGIYDLLPRPYNAGWGVYSNTYDNIKVTKEVEAGAVEVPTASITAVDGINRTVTFACATDGVTFSYSTDDGANWTTADYIVISANTDIIVKATKSAKSAQSGTLSFEAGTNITLNTPTWTKTGYSAGVSTVTLADNQSDKLLNPATTIKYQIDDNPAQTYSSAISVNDGETLKYWSEAAGYTKSADGSVTATAPSTDPTIFSETYNGSDASITVNSAEVVTTIGGSATPYYYMYANAAHVSDYLLTSNTSRNNWLLRATGIYSGQGVSYALSGVKKNDIVTITIVWGTEKPEPTATDGTLDSWNSVSGSTYVFKVTSTMGNFRFNLGRYASVKTITIQRAPASVTVSAAGYATYVNNDNDLDFSASDIKAYKVQVTAKGVATMTQVDNVPARTPVLLYKDGGATEDIPAMIGAAAVSGNDLVAGTGAAVATTDGGYTNMILNNGTSGVGFYLAAGQTVAANRAYLHFDSSLAPNALAPMMMVFDGEATGINEVKGEGLKVNGYYDLQGRKVAQPTKGLYIVNGKKVVIK